MGKINFIYPLSLIFFMLFGTVQFVWGQGSENFDNATNLPSGSNYGNGNFTGNNGIIWNYVHAQSAGTYSIDGNGILLRRSNEPSSLSASLTGGISSFSVDTRKGYAGNAQRRMELVINGSVVEQFEPVYPSGESDQVVQFTVDNINVSGNFTLELRLFGAAGNQHIVLDNITWSGYSDEEPQDPPVVTAETFNGTVGVAASFQIQATGSPDSYAVASGTLPAGLTLNEDTGLISGLPASAGNSSVTITATNDAGTSPAVTINFEIAAGTQTMTPAFTDISKYDTDVPFSLPAATDQGISITYNSTNTSVASISGNTVTITGIGTTTIEASNTGNTNYNPFNDSFMLTVTEEQDVYNGNGTFVKINSIEELTNGYYVIAANPEFGDWAMSNTHNGTFLNRTAISPSSETVIDPDVTIVWKIESNGSGRTIYNDNSAKYVSFTGNSNNIQIVDAVTSDNQRWNITFGNDDDEEDVFIFNNVAVTNRILQYNSNSGQERFAAYTSNQRKFALYKLSESAGEGVIWTTANEWSNGTGPTISDDVIIEGNLTTASDLSANTLTVEAGGSIVISSGNTVTIEGAITNNATAADFVVQNDANLIQNTATTNNNTGNITVVRNNQPFVRLDYTMWSSPVSGQQIQAFSPETLPDRIYTYNGSSGYVTVPNASADFTEARGYMFRAPNNWDENTATAYTGQFIGVPFSGDINVNTYAGNFTSIGNPYASNINADTFLATNPDVSALYFWTNTNPVVGNSYSGNNYATYTFMGGTGTIGPENNETNVPNGFISTGQGFIVESTGTSARFDNGMRVGDVATFFRVDETERHRIWLNLKGHNQILVGYMAGATNNTDNQIDAKMFGYEGSALYNLIDNDKYTIQGRALPFEISDIVPLGFKAVENGTFTISLAHVDGLFADGETTVYLKDKSANIIHNLTAGNYIFQSEAGEFNDRFEVVYEDDGTLGVDDLTSNSVQIYKYLQNIVVESKSEKIISVELFDLTGRNIHSNNKVNSNTYQIKSVSKGILVVRVQTKDGKIITKKVINN